jgi:TonB family protein
MGRMAEMPSAPLFCKKKVKSDTNAFDLSYKNTLKKLASFRKQLDGFAMHTNTHGSTFRSAICAIIIALLVASPFTAANAKWLAKVNPRLPVGVYFQGLEGSVVLSLTLDRSGRVTDTRVLRSSGHAALDELARNAAVNWRLSPDSVLSSDLVQGRVELVTFRNSNPPKAILPGSEPYWARLKG